MTERTIHRGSVLKQILLAVKVNCKYHALLRLCQICNSTWKGERAQGRMTQKVLLRSSLKFYYCKDERT